MRANGPKQRAGIGMLAGKNVSRALLASASGELAIERCEKGGEPAKAMRGMPSSDVGASHAGDGDTTIEQWLGWSRGKGSKEEERRGRGRRRGVWM